MPQGNLGQDAFHALLVNEKLPKCESGFNPRAIHLNDGAIGSHSYGLLQFKPDTIYHYAQHYEYDLERAEVMNVIYDPAFQQQLANLIIIDGGWRNWTNCLKPYFQ